MNSWFIDELGKLFFFFKPFKNLSLMICYIYNPFIFVLIISSYRLIIFAALSRSCTSSASLFRSSHSKTSSIVTNPIIWFLFLLLINVSPFYYPPSLSISINKKVNTLVPNLKTKNIYVSWLFTFKLVKG